MNRIKKLSEKNCQWGSDHETPNAPKSTQKFSFSSTTLYRHNCPVRPRGDPGWPRGDPGVTQVWPRVTQGWPRGNPGVTQGQCFLGVKLGQPRGDVGATRGQSLLGLPPGRPWVTSGLPPSCPGSLPIHPGTKQQSCTVQQAFFFCLAFRLFRFQQVCLWN